jgi:hypothetical protein
MKCAKQLQAVRGTNFAATSFTWLLRLEINKIARARQACIRFTAAAARACPCCSDTCFSRRPMLHYPRYSAQIQWR